MDDGKEVLATFLPTTVKETKERGWDYVDVILITGDAYVDHPSFGNAVIARTLEAEGYRVAIVAQPNWKDDLRDFKKFGKPRLFFGVTSGNMDSMVNHYTARKRLRSNDSFTPGGESGFRPDYAAVVYSQIVKSLYPDTPLVLGGIEASMRRLAHYDYWSDSLKPSVLIESKADMLVYGMGEKAVVQISKQLEQGISIGSMNEIPQTAFVRNQIPDTTEQSILLHSYEVVQTSKRKQAENFGQIERCSNTLPSARLVQLTGEHYVIVNPAEDCFSQADLDASFALPYTREPHPKYRKRGPIPAFEMIKFSVNTHRGCFGGCSFCTISAHQGKQVVSRSVNSILNEVEQISKLSDFKGNLSDLGGPSANMYEMRGRNLDLCRKCSRYSCIYPKHCANLESSHKPLRDLYKRVSKLPYIKKVFIGSGVRYDLFTRANEGYEYFEDLVKNHVSGRLKVAPEHSSEAVLEVMRKPSFTQFIELKKEFERINAKEKKNQQLIPYFISAHPGCHLEDMAQLALDTKRLHYYLEQVQDFTPTPMTLSTEMYYTGIDPYTAKSVYTAKTFEEKSEQNRLFFWYKPENKAKIMQSLRKLKNATYFLQGLFSQR